MKFKRNRKTDRDLEKFSDEELSLIPLAELQRISNKRWAHGLDDLHLRAKEELKRRDPRRDWRCNRCGKEHFHQKEIRVSGGFMESFLGWERNLYHAIVCNYCGKTEFYSVLMPASEQGIGLMGS